VIKESSRRFKQIFADVDECSDGTYICTQPYTTCANAPGSYDCVCQPGYTSEGTVIHISL